MATRDVGERMESVARTYLERRGLAFVTRNFRTRGGEIDLIMTDNSSLVFVEVRYRETISFGGALESVTSAKRRRLLGAARAYLARFRVQPVCRFDVVSMSGPAATPQINWLKAAFDATEGSWAP